MGTRLIDGFLSVPDDTANISYDVQAEFLEREKMPFASNAVTEGKDLVCVRGADVTRVEQRKPDEC